MKDIDEFVRAAVARSILGEMSRSTFYRKVAAGELQAVKVGAATYVRRSEIERFMTSCQALVARSGLTLAGARGTGANR